MTASVAEVVAQLRAAADQLDTAAVTATRAQADAEQAHGHFTEAGRGSNHADIRAATTESQTAAAKAGKVGRLMAQAADRLIAYANHIAPGSAPNRTANDAATPSGEDLVADSTARQDRRAKIGGFLNRTARKADETQDQASQGAQAVEAVTKMFRNPHGPGSQTTGTANPTAPPPATRQKIDSSEAAGNLVVVGLLAGVAVHKLTTNIKQWIARSKGERRSKS